MLTGITFIIATIGRPSLAHTLASIECWPGDDVLVIGNVIDLKLAGTNAMRYIPCTPGGDWGSTERNIATRLATGRYLAHIDDDDVYAPGARAAMALAIEESPDCLSIFKMQYPDGSQLWRDPMIRWGNVGTPMILIPNDPKKMGTWGEKMDCGDLHFLQTMQWAGDAITWHKDVIAHVSAPHR